MISLSCLDPRGEPVLLMEKRWPGWEGDFTVAKRVAQLALLAETTFFPHVKKFNAFCKNIGNVGSPGVAWLGGGPLYLGQLFFHINEA